MFAAALAVAAVVSSVSAPAWAVDYPSWEDVQAAKGNEQAKQAEISRIEGLIADAAAQVQQTEAIAQQRGAEYQAAQEEFDSADQKANALQGQADASKTEADAATARAGLLAAQLYRSGGADLGTGLLLDGDSGNADQLLAKLGQASKLAEINSGVYSSALSAKNSAQALSDQAQVARDEREKLRVTSEQKLAEANAAAQAAEAQLAEQQQMGVVLEQQLAALKDETAATVEQYQTGVEERRKAAEAAAAAAGGGSGDWGQLSDQGWAKPGYGRITDNFGPRPSQPAGANAYHRGTDIGTGCSANIYAATSGTVVYSGWYGTYGNFIEISHGDGVSTGYAHIRDGGRFVGYGQYVEAGQVIASSGSTGSSTACHLHFEVRIDGTAIDAVPFMRDRGAALG
jgi:murein DD-endopeptidase MepM/ murein hydrolase activator NlpD